MDHRERHIAIYSLRYNRVLLKSLFPFSPEKKSGEGLSFLTLMYWKNVCETCTVDTNFFPLKCEKTFIWVTKLIGSLMVVLLRSLPSRSFMIYVLSFFLVTNRLKQNSDGSSHSWMILNSMILNSILCYGVGESTFEFLVWFHLFTCPFFQGLCHGNVFLCWMKIFLAKDCLFGGSWDILNCLSESFLEKFVFLIVLYSILVVGGVWWMNMDMGIFV
jgi:hypothetical protein